MWVQVDPTHAGEKSWINPDSIMRCDVNQEPTPPWAILTLQDGTECTVSEPRAMKILAKLLGTELPKNPEAGEGYIMF